MRAVPLAGLAFHPLMVKEAADWIASRDVDAPFGYVVTPNADHLVRVAADASLRQVYDAASLCLLDSRVVAGLARLFRLPAPPVAPGSDLTEQLLQRHVHPNERVTIIGLAPHWLPALTERYRLTRPAHFDPPMGFERDPAALAQTVAFVRANPARFVFLAVGSPRQEHLAAAIVAAGGAVGTGLCIGASLDFLAGAQVRAPAALQHAGLEWAFRLVTHPARMAHRYLVDSPRVIPLLLRQRRQSGQTPPA